MIHIQMNQVICRNLPGYAKVGQQVPEACLSNPLSAEFLEVQVDKDRKGCSRKRTHPSFGVHFL